MTDVPSFGVVEIPLGPPGAPGPSATARSVVTVTDTVTLAAEQWALVDASGGSLFLFLPAPTLNAVIVARRIDGTGATVTVQPPAGVLFNNSSSTFILNLPSGHTFVGDGTTWWTL